MTTVRTVFGGRRSCFYPNHIAGKDLGMVAYGCSRVRICRRLFVVHYEIIKVEHGPLPVLSVLKLLGVMTPDLSYEEVKRYASANQSRIETVFRPTEFKLTAAPLIPPVTSFDQRSPYS